MAVLAALVAILATLIVRPADAQQEPMVRCRVGAWVGVTTSCGALDHGARELRFRGTDMDKGHSITACARDVGATLGQYWSVGPYQACMAVFQAGLNAGW